MNKESITSYPTKNFFINIITRDIEVLACILDLIDNSVDSYTRQGYKESREIKIILDEQRFEIFDNCGGISKEILTKKVFLFGVEQFTSDNPTLGLYGIGLKRSLFKIGKDITLETDDGKDYSLVSFNVNTWASLPSWDIPYDTDKSSLTDGKPYTKIEIKTFNEGISKIFSNVPFLNELATKVGIIYTKFIMDHGINISINNETIQPFPIKITMDDQFTPESFIEQYESSPGKEKIDIRILCGLKPKSARKNFELGVDRRGWNLFCNDRLILVDNTDELTGWTGKPGELPKFHQLYNRFQGYVFLTSNDPSLLPLDTTKTKLKRDDQFYLYLLGKMIECARVVIDFIGKQNQEEKETIEQLEKQVEDKDNEDATEPKEVDIKDIINNTMKFSAPTKRNVNNEYVTISYRKPKKSVEKVKEFINVTSNKKVGEHTFDYYLQSENLE